MIVPSVLSAADLVWQGHLFETDEPPDPSFAGLRRLTLPGGSWVDHCPGWLPSARGLFEELIGSGRFEQRERTVWDQRRPEPRLTASWNHDVEAEDLPASLRGLTGPLDARYGIAFDRVFVNLYRDGRDSVAWHRDRNGHTHAEPLVVTLSLGARRRFLLRPHPTGRVAGSAPVALTVGAGDLVVMGGRCQHDWQHSVPKQAGVVGARMSVTMRHSAHWPHLPVPVPPAWVQAEWARSQVAVDS